MTGNFAEANLLVLDALRDHDCTDFLYERTFCVEACNEVQESENIAQFSSFEVSM